jgi:hypothetical protein
MVFVSIRKKETNVEIILVMTLYLDCIAFQESSKKEFNKFLRLKAADFNRN